MQEAEILDELVTVASFDNDMDARLALECLACAGIKAYLADHSLVGTAWHLAGALGGVKLQVASRQRDEAAAILSKAQAGELELNEEDWPGGDEDDDVDATEVQKSERDLMVDRAVKSMVLSLLFLPLSLYTAWIMLDVATTEGELSPVHRLRSIWTGVATAIALSLFLLLLRGMARRMI